MSSIENKLCFEKEYADIILRSPEYFKTTLDKVSRRICKLMNTPINLQFLKKNNILSDKLLHELYSDSHFGVIGKSISFCPSQNEFLLKIKEILIDEKTEMPLIVHLHQIFMQCIYDRLPFKSSYSDQEKEKNTLVQQLFTTYLFKDNRLLSDINAGEYTNQIGASSSLNCPQNTNTTIPYHKNILGKFKLNLEGDWSEVVTTRKLPFIGGPSGHTGSSILVAKLVGRLDEKELQTYVTAVLGVLVGGGYHTVDEVMAVAKEAGINYSYGNYSLSIPHQLRRTPEIEQLKKQYSLFFKPQQESKPIEMIKQDQANSNSTLVNSSIHGVAFGASNYLNRYLIASGVNKNKALLLKNTVHYGSLFAVKFLQNMLTTTVSSINNLYITSVETGNILLILAGIYLIQIMIELLSNMISQYSTSLNPMADLLKNHAPLVISLYVLATSPEEVLPSLIIGFIACTITENSLETFMPLPRR